MAPTQNHIDLYSHSNEIILNPRWPRADYDKLHFLAESAQKSHGLRGHVWLATSGSTASSIAETKLVAISKNALQCSAQAVNEHLRSDAQDIWSQVLPHFHVGGLGIEVRALLSGARVVSALKEQRWDVDHFYKTLQEQRCTLSALVPTQVYDLVARGYSAPSALRAVIVGGGAFEVELYKKARALKWPVLPSYGMTETASQIATAPLSSLDQEEYPVLQLLPHARAQANEDGYLQVQADSLFTCYAQNSDQGATCWDPRVNGWFTTEDRGEVIAGALYIQGRSKDYIKIGGEGTNVARLRSLLDNSALQINPQWPAKLALLDMPSDRLGAEIHLVSLLDEAATEKVVQAYTERVLPFEKIRRIYYMQEIPRSDLGKILWGELRRRL